MKEDIKNKVFFHQIQQNGMFLLSITFLILNGEIRYCLQLRCEQ